MERPVPLMAASAGDATKRCPDCAEKVLADARVCKHCGYRFAPVAERSTEAAAGQILAGFPAGTVVAFGGLVLLAIGSIGPWATILAVSVPGTRGDGELTLGLAVFAALMLATKRRVPVALAFLAILVAGLVAGYDLVNTERVARHVTIFGVQAVSAGWGVYTALVGAVVALLALIPEHFRLYHLKGPQ